MEAEVAGKPADPAADDPEATRLRQLLRACEVIWPAIRVWGLCGAAPHYVVASLEIGRLLGHIKDGPAADGSQVDVTKIVAETRMETIAAISRWARESNETRGLAGRSGQERFGKMIEELAGDRS